MTMHVEDGALLRWLDGESEGAERRDLAAHLGGCTACETRLVTLRNRAAGVSRALRAADPVPARRPRRTGWGLRAAAGFAVLLGVGFAVEPVRAWILERADQVWAAVTDQPDAEPAGTGGDVTPAQDPAPGSITFVPSGDVFLIDVASRQAGGQLVIETAAVRAASAVLRGGTGQESFVVLPSGLRVVNDPASVADYVLRVPARLRAIDVVVGSAPRRRYEPTGVGERWTVPLGGRAGER